MEAIHRGAELRRLARWVLADLLLFAAGGLWLQARGQNDGRMHQYMFSQQDFNPSFAGSQGLIDVYTLFRQQWVGYGKGAPQLLFLNFDIYPFIRHYLKKYFSILYLIFLHFLNHFLFLHP